MPPDASAIAEVLAGNPESFGLIVDRYEQALLRVAFSRLGQRDRAEEAVQETFFNAFRSLHTYDSRYSFRTWLWTILLNQCRRQYQKSQRKPTTISWESVDFDDGPMPHPADASTPDAVAISREKKAVLEALLTKLPPSQADALRLRFYGGLKYQEIADTTHCSLSTAKNRVREGLLRLSEHLHRDEPLRNSLLGDSR